MTSTLYLHVDDADELAAEWRKAGMQVVEPDDYDYGKREGRMSTRTATSFGSGHPG